MGVPLQLILGLLLALTPCSFANDPNLRQIREAPPPILPATNVSTEINNRDLNRIVKSEPKAEDVNLKTKTNAFNQYRPALTFATGSDDVENGNDTSKERLKAPPKEPLREDKSIDVNSSRFWPSNLHSKSGFTDNHRDPDSFTFEGTRHPSFDSNTELTTPTTKFFDRKFKETVESVEQNIDVHDTEAFLEDIAPVNGTAKNESLQFIKTISRVKNETANGNSIRKGEDVEQIKKVSFETTYNDTTTYDEEETTRVTATTISTPTTRKNIFPLVFEQTGSHLLSNKIETETQEPVKIVASNRKDKEPKEMKNVLSSTEKPITTTTTLMTTAATSTASISDQENIISSDLGADSTPAEEVTSLSSPTPVLPQSVENPQPSLEQYSTEALPATTETSTITDFIESTTPFDVTGEQSDDTSTTEALSETTTSMGEETTTTLAFSTEVSGDVTTIILENLTPDNIYRTSKRLEETIVTEHMLKVDDSSPENSTENVSTGTESTVRNDEETTALNRVIEKSGETDETTIKEDSSVQTTAINEMDTTTLVSPFMEPISTSSEAETSTETNNNLDISETVTEPLLTTNEAKSTAEVDKMPTTEFPFVQTEKIDRTDTTPLPEVLGETVNYSTTALLEKDFKKVKKIVTDKSNPIATAEPDSSPSTVVSTTVSTTTPSTTTSTEAPTEDSYSSDGVSKGKIAAIVISSVGAVCLVLLAGLLYVMKKRQKRLNYGPRCRPVSLDDYSIDNLSVYNSVRRKGGARLSKRSFGNPAFDDPVAPTHPLNFPALAKFSTNLEDIKAEFEEIPQISARTSELPDGCETKNRYANVIPLPETRVFLKPIDGYPNSDYINANYVTGPKNTKGYYIATQGPMQNTVDDFWRMIWEQQVKVVLMLTHLVENGLEKCVDYLPESEVIDCSRLFGDFQIILKKQEVKDKYIISTIQLKNMVSNSWREVTHFWYLGWPEKGVPSEANSLIAFLIEARSYMKTATIDKRDGLNGIQNGGLHNEHHPVVVHCSPGTGRTGVAIACDIAIREFETTRLVDIPKIVYRIRRDRASAVQTKEQYIFVYKVVSLYATKLTGGALEHF